MTKQCLIQTHVKLKQHKPMIIKTLRKTHKTITRNLLTAIKRLSYLLQQQASILNIVSPIATVFNSQKALP